MTTTLYAVPLGDDRAEPAQIRRRSTVAPVSSELVSFAHLARLALPLSDLDARELRDLRRDLVWLVHEATRPRLRPRLLDTLIDAVLDELLPALPAPTRHALGEARPTIAVLTDSAS